MVVTNSDRELLLVSGLEIRTLLNTPQYTAVPTDTKKQVTEGALPPTTPCSNNGVVAWESNCCLCHFTGLFLFTEDHSLFYDVYDW